MIAHVAERGEDRGRVVLQTGSAGALSRVAVEAAVLAARAFASEIECIFVENEDLAECTRFSFIREFPASGHAARELSLAGLETAWIAAAREASDAIVAAAREHDVPVLNTTVRDRIGSALIRACTDRGPWNLVALGEALNSGNAIGAGHLLSIVHGTTGVLAAGLQAKSIAGPVIAVAEVLERVPPMWRAAERIASVAGAEALVLIVNRGGNVDRTWLEGQVRLALAGESGSRFTIVATPHEDPAVLAEHVRRLNPGLVILQFGGLAAPSDAALSELSAVLDGALLVVR